jgi:hypothetical protein
MNNKYCCSDGTNKKKVEMLFIRTVDFLDPCSELDLKISLLGLWGGVDYKDHYYIY